MSPQILLLAFLLVFGSSLASADLGRAPYDPESDRAKLASDLGVPDNEMLLDRRCVFSKTDTWVATAPLTAFKVCVLVLTPEQLILSNFDASKNRYNSLVNYRYSDIQEVALREDPLDKPELNIDGKKYQIQFLTEEGFISVSAYRGKQGDRSIDSRGARDAFDIIQSKGVVVVESQGRIEFQRPRGPLMLFKTR